MPEVHRLDLMAEQSVIGAILLTDRCLTDVERELRPTDFRLEGDRALYEAALALERDGEKVDSVTILDRARKMGAQISRQYVLELMELTPTAANVMEYVRLVKEESLRAALMETADRIREGVEGREPPSAVLSAAGQRLDDLASQSSLGRLVTPADGFLAFFLPAGRCGGRGRQGLCLHRLYGPGRAAGRRDAQLRTLSPGRKARHGENDPGS